MTDATNPRTMDTALARLPEPPAPAALSAATRTRIARIEHQPAARRGRARRAAASAGSDRLQWIWALAGHAVGTGALVYVTLAGAFAPGVTSPRAGSGLRGLVGMPDATPVALVLAAGLLIFVTALLAPLRRPR